jgi:DNA-binding CsgD family transcriptional regulator
MEKRHRLYEVNDDIKRRITTGSNGQYEIMKSLPIFINQFAYTIDYSTTKVTSCKGFDTFLGYHEEEITIDFILSLYHPDDADQVMELTARVIEWSTLFPADPFSIVFSLNYRVRKANGNFIRVFRQTTTSEIDATGKTLSVLSICTDISHLKLDDQISVRFLGPNTEVVYLDDVVQHKAGEAVLKISAREMDILALVAKGKTSLEIGNILNISLNTVNTHRRNMLARTGFNNLSQLVGHVAGKGLI